MLDNKKMDLKQKGEREKRERVQSLIVMQVNGRNYETIMGVYIILYIQSAQTIVRRPFLDEGSYLFMCFSYIKSLVESRVSL